MKPIINDITYFFSIFNITDVINIKKNPEKGSKDKIDFIVNSLVNIGNIKGFSFTKKDITKHFNYLKNQYYTNPTLKTLMDSHCNPDNHESLINTIEREKALC